MNGQDGRTESRRWAHAGSSDPRGDPSGRLSTGRLLLTCGALVVAVLMTQRMLSPLAVGWRRAEQLLAGEDRLIALAHEARWLQEEIDYKKTRSGRTLEAFEQQGFVEPGGHVVKAVPKQLPATTASRVTLTDRAEHWRERGRICLYRKWRVLALCLLNRRLPPPSEA
jgi:hypothetical protein